MHRRRGAVAGASRVSRPAATAHASSAGHSGVVIASGGWRGANDGSRRASGRPVAHGGKAPGRRHGDCAPPLYHDADHASYLQMLIEGRR